MAASEISGNGQPRPLDSTLISLLIPTKATLPLISMMNTLCYGVGAGLLANGASAIPFGTGIIPGLGKFLQDFDVPLMATEIARCNSSTSLDLISTTTTTEMCASITFSG